MSDKKIVYMNGEAVDVTDLVKEGNVNSEKIMQQQTEATSKAREILGFPGAMISGSKSGYRQAYPKNLPIFNSNVVTEKGKIWYGDIDLTLSESKLKELAKAINQTVYVLLEMDGRFENESSPRLDRAQLVVTSTGEVSGEVLSYSERPTRGRLANKLVYKNA